MSNFSQSSESEQGIHVLVVEDDPATRDYLQKLLEKWGYHCRVASDGLMAQEALLLYPVDLAIIDWLMPRMDGLTLLRSIRQNRKLDYIYCIMLTTRCTHEDFLLGMEAGADDYLTKPFLESDLRARLRVGERIIAYQKQLQQYNQKLQQAMNDLHALQGFIHMCAYCNSVYTPEEKWVDVSEFLQRHTQITVSHGVCPACVHRVTRTPSLAQSQVK